MDRLEILRSMARLQEAMVGLAASSQWDGLSDAQGQQDALLAALRQSGGLASLPAGGECRRLIESILAGQEQVRSYVTPWMEQVSPLLKAFHPPGD